LTTPSEQTLKAALRLAAERQRVARRRLIHDRRDIESEETETDRVSGLDSLEAAGRSVSERN